MTQTPVDFSKMTLVASELLNRDEVFSLGLDENGKPVFAMHPYMKVQLLFKPLDQLDIIIGALELKAQRKLNRLIRTITTPKEPANGNEDSAARAQETLTAQVSRLR